MPILAEVVVLEIPLAALQSLAARLPRRAGVLRKLATSRRVHIRVEHSAKPPSVELSEVLDESEGEELLDSLRAIGGRHDMLQLAK